MASDSAPAAPRSRGEKLVTGGWIALAVIIPLNSLFSSEPLDVSAGLALLSLSALCTAFACWPKLLLSPLSNARSLCDNLPRGSAIAMSAFVGLTVLRGVVELVA
ncbi:hypothetical protein [Metapseudomonas furukawaii]|jgi:hypothetical protein|uniref:Uncharacterized protein n=1 Tax=Metapseudomonas furukawaii TaxID=1149133 RepID=A0AAD1FHX6_METFU|nr:hypothetical protein [Pseudomonas furukawaii]ELS26832.1 hypothetical protein ppKF707_5063 [Pseudomonas furukawaii]BAU76692.1 hypothetical protein KF707C_50040 [Pseudomonas furukawaii]